MKLLKIVLTIIIALLVAGALIGVSVLTAVCLSAGMTWTTEPADCIIVLGAHVWMDGTLSNALRYRCEAALKAWQDGIAPAIIVCGGQGNDEPEPEGVAMARWFIAHGVPKDRVFIDATSTTTVENMNNARAIMEAQGFSKAAVCTNNYHLRRALWVARDAGLDATGIAAPSTRNPISFVRGRLRETCSWILYFVRRVIRVG